MNGKDVGFFAASSRTGSLGDFERTVLDAAAQVSLANSTALMHTVTQPESGGK